MSESQLSPVLKWLPASLTSQLVQASIRGTTLSGIWQEAKLGTGTI